MAAENSVQKPRAGGSWPARSANNGARTKNRYTVTQTTVRTADCIVDAPPKQSRRRGRVYSKLLTARREPSTRKRPCEPVRLVHESSLLRQAFCEDLDRVLRGRRPPQPLAASAAPNAIAAARSARPATDH